MKPIEYRKYITWKIFLENIKDPYIFFGKKPKKRIKRSLEKINAQAEYKFKIVDVDNSFLEKFTPLYKNNINEKFTPIIYDVVDNILENQKNGRQYKAISVFKKDEFVGGLIFSIRKNSLSAAYKVFPKELDNFKLPISPTHIAEYLFINYAINCGKEFISHGRDLNAFGFKYNIGLAIFKLSLGCIPFVSISDNNEILTLSQFPDNKDILLFIGKDIDSQINQMILLSKQSEDNLREKYKELFNNSAIKLSI